MSTNDEQYDDPEEPQGEEAELTDDDLEKAAGGSAPGDELKDFFEDLLPDSE